MVAHAISLTGADLESSVKPKRPVIVQMNDDDFPARFLQTLAVKGTLPGTTITQLTTNSDAPLTHPVMKLLQPVQRMLNVALIQLNCNIPGMPRVDPKRILSAGLVVRRVYRRKVGHGHAVANDLHTHSAWMRNPQGQWSWVKLTAAMGDLDPDPTQRPPLRSGDPAVDRQLAAMTLGNAFTESTTPAFAAPPATCAALNRTLLYGMVPTASSEVSDPPSQAPAIDPGQMLSVLPSMLRSAENITPPDVPLPNNEIDYHYLSDEVLNTLFPPSIAITGTSVVALPVPDSRIADFHQFTLALRMLHTVFGAFDPGTGGTILGVLNRHQVTFHDGSQQGMGDFYQSAKSALFDNQGSLTMPVSWDWLNNTDETDLLTALQGALTPRSQSLNLLPPMGRYQDSTRLYQLRVFVRLKGDQPQCPPHLLWSDYSEPFQIAAWHESGSRAHPPVPLPDLTPAALKKAKPNCSFQVPGNLMNAMQKSSMSGLMQGSGSGSSGLSLGWICGFNIPLITICAFFVLNIFLQLLNIVFFWLPFIKICIPFPTSSNSDE